jgi:transcriptional regulator of acetoin/glycerol metabolism
VEDLPDELRGAVAAPTTSPAALISRPLADVERDHILAVLDEVGGNRTKAAAVLGIGSATLFRKLKAYHAAP